MMAFFDRLLRGLARFAHGAESWIGLHPPVEDTEDSAAVDGDSGAAPAPAAGEAPVEARPGSAAHAAAIRALAADVSAYWLAQTGAPIQPQELDLLLALFGLETVWGLGWTDKTAKGQGDMRGSNNVNARQYSGPGAAWRRVEYGDTRPPTAAEAAAGQTANIPIPAPFNFYVDAEGRTAAQNGAWYAVRDLTSVWNAREALRTGSAPALARRLGPKEFGGLGYYGGFGTTEAARVGGYANAMASRLPEVAAALGRDQSVATVAPAAGAYANTATGQAQDPRLGGVADDVGAWLHGEWADLTRWLGYRAGAENDNGAAPAGGAGGETGPLSPVRQAVVDAVRAVVPSQYPDERWRRLAPLYDPAHLPSAGYTTCGELPRYALSVVGVNTRGGLASIRDLGRAAGAWVEPAAGVLPRPGDAYLAGNAAGEILHTGIVLAASPDEWTTADAGQGPRDRQAAAVLENAYDSSTATLTRAAGSAPPRVVLGWLDAERAAAAAPVALHPLAGLAGKAA